MDAAIYCEDVFEYMWDICGSKKFQRIRTWHRDDPFRQKQGENGDRISTASAPIFLPTFKIDMVSVIYVLAMVLIVWRGMEAEKYFNIHLSGHTILLQRYDRVYFWSKLGEHKWSFFTNSLLSLVSGATSSSAAKLTVPCALWRVEVDPNVPLSH